MSKRGKHAEPVEARTTASAQRERARRREDAHERRLARFGRLS